MQFISELLEQPVLLAYFIGANNYTWLHFRNGEQRLLAKPLTYFEQRLPTFVRVHKTALINPVCVADVVPPPRPKMNGAVRMRDGIELAVSRRRWPQVASLLQPGDALEPVTEVMTDRQPIPYVAPPLLMLAVMTGDALLLTRECIKRLNVSCVLHPVESGAELASNLLTGQMQRPALIMLDARIKRSDRMSALRALKSRPRLRSIPVIWLTQPSDDTMPIYELDANSVVVIPNDQASFARIIERLCRYWLTVAQLPPDESVNGVNG